MSRLDRSVKLASASARVLSTNRSLLLLPLLSLAASGAVLALLVPVGIVGLIGYAMHPWVGIALLVVGIVAVVCYISAVDAIYRVALYRYATMSETPAEFELAGFGAAFTTKKRRWF